jgi:dTDP-D-glucose 4,6-dehydratase
MTAAMPSTPASSSASWAGSRRKRSRRVWQKTVRWYLDNQAWVDEVASGEYRKWVEANYAQRA